MADVRKTILNNMVTEIQTITIANGYNTDQFETVRDVEHVANKPTRLVSWAVLDVSSADEVVYYASGNVVVQRMRITVRAQVPVIALTATVHSDRMNDVITDFRQLVHVSTFMTGLGSNVRYVALLPIEELNINTREALVRMPITVSYWYDGDTP